MIRLSISLLYTLPALSSLKRAVSICVLPWIGPQVSEAGNSSNTLMGVDKISKQIQYVIKGLGGVFPFGKDARQRSDNWRTTSLLLIGFLQDLSMDCSNPPPIKSTFTLATNDALFRSGKSPSWRTTTPRLKCPSRNSSASLKFFRYSSNCHFFRASRVWILRMRLLYWARYLVSNPLEPTQLFLYPVLWSSNLSCRLHVQKIIRYMKDENFTDEPGKCKPIFQQLHSVRSNEKKAKKWLIRPRRGSNSQPWDLYCKSLTR